MVEPGTQALEKISQHFGSDVLENGELNRAALREIVFSNATERRWLESVTVPAILQELRRILDYALSPYAILMLSSGSGRSPWIDRRLVIDVSPEVQIERVATRDSNTPEQIRAIMKTQPSREERLKYADDVIVNDGDFSQLDREITQLHQQYLNLAEQ